MDADRLLTQLVVSYCEDTEVAAIASLGRGAYVAAKQAVDAAVHRGICRRLALLREHIGGNSAHEVRAARELQLEIAVRFFRAFCS